jgi:hypothetical protein
VYVLRRASLGADHPQTSEVRQWIEDLADEETDAEEEVLAALTLDDCPEPEEIGEAAQKEAVEQTRAALAAVAQTNARGSPMLGAVGGAGGGGGSSGNTLALPGGPPGHRPHVSISGIGANKSISLPPLGALPPVAGAASPGALPALASHNKSSSLLPPLSIGGAGGAGAHKPAASLGALPALPGMLPKVSPPPAIKVPLSPKAPSAAAAAAIVVTAAADADTASPAPAGAGGLLAPPPQKERKKKSIVFE